MGGDQARSAVAKIGPRMRARLPAPWATPMVAPCSLVGVRFESRPNKGGRVRLVPTDNSARARRSHTQGRPLCSKSTCQESGELPLRNGSQAKLAAVRTRLDRKSVV